MPAIRLGTSIRLLLPALVLTSLSCTSARQPNDADVVVVGAGIAGLAAALEASANGASVVVVEAASVGGGHAVKAGGFSMTGTALQRRKGIEDSPELTYTDMVRWGEDPNSYWARHYANNSGAEVYDWLTNLGVEFVMLIPTPENSVPRFHFTRGRAVNVVVPMMRKALADPKIRFIWNTRATALLKAQSRIIGVVGTDERTGSKRWYRGDSVVLATGGFASNLKKVRATWPTDKNAPERLLIGSGHYATGDGYRMAEWAGANMQALDRQVTFYNGMPDPRDPTNMRALHAHNPAAIWVNVEGRRFINETADSKAVEEAVSQFESVSYWVIYDANGADRWQIRDAVWLNKSLLKETVIDNPDITVSADSIAELAAKTGLPEHGLRAALETWNRMIDVGTDFQFGRFGPDQPRGRGQAIGTQPLYATQLFPYTRKSMGGPAINIQAEVLDGEGIPIGGLYAAGELTGVAGINGKHGGSGTFLGPSVLTGRIAGQTAATASTLTGELAPQSNAGDSLPSQGLATPDAAGFWHYQRAHARVAELGWECGQCHSERNPQRMAVNAGEMLARLDTCKDCH